MPSKKFIAVLAAVACMLASGAARSETSSRLQDRLSDLDRQLSRQCDVGEFSGMILIRARGEEVYRKVCGQADPVNGIPNSFGTRFKIYSKSKFLTALAVMHLVEGGRMGLDEPLTTYVTDAPEEWAGVTVRQLLNHTFGIPDLTEELVYRFRTDHPAAMRSMFAVLTAEQRDLRSRPGQEFGYNNFGFELLADAAAKVAGVPFAELLEKSVFEPAAMTTAEVERPNIIAGHAVPVQKDGLAIGFNGTPANLQQANNWAFVQLGAGAVHASAADFVALDTALQTGKLLKPGTLDAMMADPVRPPEGGRMPSARKFGLGIMIEDLAGTRMTGHTGGTNGDITDFQRVPDQDAMMIILTNRGFTKTAGLRQALAKALVPEK